MLSADAGDRAEKLAEALEILRRAIALNPDRSLLDVASMRANAIAGNGPQMKIAAHDALRAAPDNRVVIGMVGSTLAGWGDPEGQQLLNGLKDEEGPTYPWEHVGRFISAMMRDDVVTAGQEADELERFNTGQPLLLIVKAAHASRVGRADEARAALERLRSDPRIRLAGIDQVIERLPIGPEVRAKLRTWLPRELQPRSHARDMSHACCPDPEAAGRIVLGMAVAGTSAGASAQLLRLLERAIAAQQHSRLIPVGPH